MRSLFATEAKYKKKTEKRRDRRSYGTIKEWKKRSEETQTLRAGCCKAEPKNLPRRRSPSRGQGTAKI